MVTSNPARRPWSADQAVIHDLFGEHFNALWDFLGRLLRRQTEIEEVLVATFQRATDEISALSQSTTPRAWLFRTARQLALDLIEDDDRGLPVVFLRREGRAVDLDVIDRGRLQSGHLIAPAQRFAGVIWEAIADLNPDQYSLLDLALRQDLDPDEIAAVLEMPPDEASAMVERLRTGVEESITLYLIERVGRRRCPVLNSMLEEIGGSGLSPETRAMVARHVDGCSTCREIRAELPSPTTVIAAFARLRPPPGSYTMVQDVILQPDTVVSRGRGWSLPMVLGGALAILGGLLLLGASFGVAASDEPAADPVGEPGLTISFETEDGDPVPGVQIRVEIATPDGTETIERTTAGSGMVDLTGRGPGRYSVTLLSLPPELGTASSTPISDVEVDDQERIELVCTFRSSAFYQIRHESAQRPA